MYTGRKKHSRLRVIVPVTIVILILLLAVSPFRKMQAKKKAAQFTLDHPVSTEYDVPGDVSNQEEYALELLHLICWEEDTKRQLDQVYEDVVAERWEEVPAMNQVSGYGKAEDLYHAALSLEWSRARRALDETTRNAIDALCGQIKPGEGIFSQEKIIKCYEFGSFLRIARSARQAEAGKGERILPISEYSAFSIDSSSWENLYVEAAGLAWPDRIREVCVQYLEEFSLAAKSEGDSKNTKALESVVNIALFLEERCGIDFPEITSYQEQVEQLIWANKPDVPSVGMYVSSAYDTKLGKPDEYKYDYYESHNRNISSYTYGSMTWLNEDGDCIFAASFRDDVLTDVSDNRAHPFHYGRKSDSSASGNSSNSGGSDYSGGSSYSGGSGAYYNGSDEIDPDDYDLDGYYEDRQDEYYDYDDMYDDFLDDEDAWEDY